jgi:hypothetical protein
LEFLFSAVVDEFLFEQIFEFLLVGIFDEFAQFLLVEIKHHLFGMGLFDAIFEGGEEGDGFCEISLEHDLFEELELLAIVYEADLAERMRTPDSRSRVRKASM